MARFWEVHISLKNNYFSVFAAQQHKIVKKIGYTCFVADGTFLEEFPQSSGKTAIKKRSHATNYSNVLRDDLITTDESRPKET